MLPNGWQIKSVLELGRNDPNTVQTGPFGSQLHSEDYVEEGVPLLLIRNIGANGLILDDLPRISEQDAQRLAKYALQPGDIVFSRVGRVGSCFLATENQNGWIISGQTLRIRLPYYGLDPHYFLFALRDRDAQEFITGASVGSTRSSINTAILKSLPVRVPPYPEQTAIAEVLATVDRAIAQSEALIAKQRRIKAGLLHDLLTRGIDAQGNLRHPSTHRFKASPVGTVPVEWEVGLLDTVAEIGSGITLGRSVSGSDVVEMPYLRVANVQDGYIDLSDIKTVHIYRHEIPRFLLQPGDVLMNEGGDYDKLGRGAVWRGQIAPCLHQNHVFRVRANPTRLLPDFLALVSASPYGRRFFIVSSKQSTNLASINSTQLKSFPVPLPSIEEQETIVEILDVCDAAVDAEDTRRLKLQRLKTGLMQDLLSGRVSVAGLLQKEGLLI